MPWPSDSVLTLQPHPYGEAAFEKVGVRVMSIWWRWRESNPRPKRSPREYLRVQFVYNISFVPGRQTGRHIGSFMSSWPPAKLKAAHVQYLIDALALFGTKTGRTAAYN